MRVWAGFDPCALLGAQPGVLGTFPLLSSFNYGPIMKAAHLAATHHTMRGREIPPPHITSAFPFTSPLAVIFLSFFLQICPYFYLHWYLSTHEVNNRRSHMLCWRFGGTGRRVIWISQPMKLNGSEREGSVYSFREESYQLLWFWGYSPAFRLNEWTPVSLSS